MATIERGSGSRLTEQVAEEIRALLARRRISGRELARRLGASPSWVNFRLTGAQSIDLDDLQRIADVLEVEVAELLPQRGRSVVNSPGTTVQTTGPSLDQAKRPLPTGQMKPATPPKSSRRPARLVPIIPELIPDTPMELLAA